MDKIFKEIFWEDLKKDVKFFVKNLKDILRRTWQDFLEDLKSE